MIKLYTDILDQLNPRESLASRGKRRVALLSGQSDYAHSELSPEQLNVLNHVKTYGYEVIPTGFPYNRAHRPEGTCTRAKMIRASWRNISQFLLATWSRRHQRALATHLQPLFDHAERVIILCQSQGVHMLQRALSNLKISPQTQVTVIALGPVGYPSLSDSRCTLHVVKGRRDWISRRLDSHPVDHLIDADHFDYFQRPATLRLIGEIIDHEDRLRRATL